MQQKRALESAEEVNLRQVIDSTRRALKWALETSDETLNMQEQDRAYNVKKRASEKSAKILWQDQARKSKKRACETVVEMAQRQEQDQK